MAGDLGGVVDGDGLVVGQERAGAGDIRFGLLVGAAVNGIVGALKKKSFAIQHQLDAGIGVLGVQTAQAFARQHDGNGDVVFDLHFVGGMKIGAQFVNAPGAVAVVAHPEVVIDELLVVILEFVALDAVDAVDGEVLAPVVSPLGAVIALHGEQEFADVCKARCRSRRCAGRCIPTKA